MDKTNVVTLLIHKIAYGKNLATEAASYDFFLVDIKM